MIVPVVSKNSDLLESLRGLLPRFASVDGFAQVSKDNYVELVGAHGLLVIDIGSTSRSVCSQVIESFHVDDWSAHQVIVLIVDAKNRAFAQELSVKFSSIIAVLPSRNIEEYLCGVLYLFELNRNLLTKIRLQAACANEAYARFVLYNNPYAIPTFARSLSRLLHYYGFVHRDKVRDLQLVLSELCVNGVEHGNCMISYAEKKEWLETHADSFELILNKNKSPEIAARFVTCVLCINASSMRFEIVDQGNGFKWREFVDQDAVVVRDLDAHGYGINLALVHAQNLAYNAKGNAVSFSIPVTGDPQCADSTDLFSGGSHVTYKQGENITAYNPQNKSANTRISVFDNKKIKLFLLVDGMTVATIGDKTFYQDSNDIFCGVIPLMLCQMIHQPLKIKAATTARLVALQPSEIRTMLSDGTIVQSLNQSLTRIVAVS